MAYADVLSNKFFLCVCVLLLLFLSFIFLSQYFWHTRKSYGSARSSGFENDLVLVLKYLKNKNKNSFCKFLLVSCCCQSGEAVCQDAEHCCCCNHQGIYPKSPGWELGRKVHIISNNSSGHFPEMLSGNSQAWQVQHTIVIYVVILTSEWL